MSNPEKRCQSGWGEGSKLFVNHKALVHNQAASGRSARSFMTENRWAAVRDSIQRGNYVVIQFGHNDENSDSFLHTDPVTSYKQLLKRCIDETRSKGSIPVVYSSIVHRHFDAGGNLINTHGAYIQASREAAVENKAYFVGREAKSRQLVVASGHEKSKSLFVYCKPGECPKRAKGVQDSTHLNYEGTRQIAGLFAADVKKQKLSLAKALKY